MQYEIIGQTVQAVEMTLQAGESIFTQSGGMVWQTEGVEMRANARGGWKSLGRLFTGESIFMANYTAMANNVKIAFGAAVPGSILPLDMAKGEWICQKGAFLCAEQSVGLQVAFTKNSLPDCLAAKDLCCSGSGRGLVFLEIDGDRIVRALRAGEELIVDSGNLVAFSALIAYEIQMVKGVGNVLFGGEGLFNTRLTGPGQVILQTQNFGDMANRVGALAPSKSSVNDGIAEAVADIFN